MTASKAPTRGCFASECSWLLQGSITFGARESIGVVRPAACCPDLELYQFREITLELFGRASVIRKHGYSDARRST